MEEGFFEYIVDVWNEDTSEEEKVCGLTFASSYANAVLNIEEYYGDSLMAIEVSGLEQSSCYDFDLDGACGNIFNASATIK